MTVLRTVLTFAGLFVAAPAVALVQQQVPEPSALSLLGGLAVIAVVVHRMRSRRK